MITHRLLINIGGFTAPLTITGNQVIRPGVTVFLDDTGKWIAEVPTATIIEHTKK